MLTAQSPVRFAIFSASQLREDGAPIQNSGTRLHLLDRMATVHIVMKNNTARTAPVTISYSLNKKISA